MQIKIIKKILSSTMEVAIDEKDTREALAQATFYLAPDYCGLCKATNIIWTSNKPTTDKGTFVYIKRLCLSCMATSTAGEHKDGNSLFWKKWEPKFETNNQAIGNGE